MKTEEDSDAADQGLKGVTGVRGSEAVQEAGTCWQCVGCSQLKPLVTPNLFTAHGENAFPFTSQSIINLPVTPLKQGRQQREMEKTLTLKESK